MVYNYTRPKGPIAAAYNSPGPRYGLPCLVGRMNHDPRSTHSRGPAFQFGIRHGKVTSPLLTSQSSPGPCYLPPSDILRTGRSSVPAYSLTSRLADTLIFSTPGPGSYAPERSIDGCHRHPPAFTFGLKHKSNYCDSIPGPNAYFPLLSIGQTSVESRRVQAPRFSMSSRTKFGSLFNQVEQTPGPASYSMPEMNKIKSDCPKYSITGKFKETDNHFQPGPGAYRNERVWLNKVQCPLYSFGIKHSQHACSTGVRSD